jgi:transposase
VDHPRENGYSPIGERCYATKDWHARGRINAIGAITDFKLFNVGLFDCTIDSDVFYAWVTQELLPNTPKNAVIVMDNATFHKRDDTLLEIQQNGYTLEFLPPYSPDLNPIEKKWAQVKSIRRKFGYTTEQLFTNLNLCRFIVIRL